MSISLYSSFSIIIINWINQRKAEHSKLPYDWLEKLKLEWHPQKYIHRFPYHVIKIYQYENTSKKLGASRKTLTSLIFSVVGSVTHFLAFSHSKNTKFFIYMA
jgi:hypothetical protein